MSTGIRDEIQKMEQDLGRARYLRDRYGSNPIPWTVYGIYDVRYIAPFYIGVTRNLEQRALGHSHASDKPVRARVEDVEADGGYCGIAGRP